jgi:histone H3/H4
LFDRYAMSRLFRAKVAIGGSSRLRLSVGAAATTDALLDLVLRRLTNTAAGFAGSGKRVTLRLADLENATKFGPFESIHAADHNSQFIKRAMSYATRAVKNRKRSYSSRF